jgi:hypothetical protein
MARTCTVCTHDEGHAINVALVQREPYRHIASRYGVTTGALQRHLREHIPRLLVKARENVEVSDAERLATELVSEKAHIRRLRDKAEEEGDLRTALAGCDKALKVLDLEARVAQVIQTQPVINLHTSPEWIELRAIIFASLRSFPEARDAVVRGIEQVGNGPSEAS